MEAEIISKFITQQVAAAMAKKTKQYEKNIKSWRKVEKTEFQESQQKRYEGSWTRLQGKQKINNSNN